MYQRIIVNLTTGVRREKLEGQDHLVVPGVILAEDVLEGSGGPVFYSDEENEKSELSWNHKPVVVYHPEDNGKPVSAADPVILNTRKIGILLKTKNRNKKLGTQVWLNEERTASVDARILDCINKGEKVEVSTGLGFDPEDSPGEHNGKKYSIVARNYRPDHLAILPDKIGALSVQSGGGLLQLNQALRQPESIVNALQRSVVNRLKAIGMELKNNELSFSQIQYQIYDLLSSQFGEPGKYWSGWVQEVYPDKVVFETGGKCYMIGYSTKGDVISLDGDATEAKRVVEYVTVGGDTYTANSDSLLPKVKEVAPVSEKKFDKKTHVTGLIGNGFEESDRPWLEKLDDLQLEKIHPKAKVEVPVPEPKPVVNEDKKTPVDLKPITLNDLTDPKDRAMVSEWRRAHEEEKSKLVTDILANEKCPFKKEFLEGKDLPELRGLAMMAAVPTPEPEPTMFRNNYFGAAGGVVNNGNKPAQEILESTPLKFESCRK